MHLSRRLTFKDWILSAPRICVFHTMLRNKLRLLRFAKLTGRCNRDTSVYRTMIQELNFWREYYAFSRILYLKVLITYVLRLVVDVNNTNNHSWPANRHLITNFRPCDCASRQILIIKPTRCTNFSNLFWNETLNVTCVTYNIAVCTVKNSWRWTGELSETCRVSFQNKLEKLVHLVGFIVRTILLLMAIHCRDSEHIPQIANSWHNIFSSRITCLYPNSHCAAFCNRMTF